MDKLSTFKPQVNNLNFGQIIGGQIIIFPTIKDTRNTLTLNDINLTLLKQPTRGPYTKMMIIHAIGGAEKSFVLYFILLSYSTTFMKVMKGV